MFILSNLRPLNDFYCFGFFKKSTIYLDFNNGIQIKSVIDTISSIFRIMRILN